MSKTSKIYVQSTLSAENFLHFIAVLEKRVRLNYIKSI